MCEELKELDFYQQTTTQIPHMCKKSQFQHRHGKYSITVVSQRSLVTHLHARKG